MSTWQESYQRWSNFKQLEPALRTKLDDLAGNEPALEDAFYKELAFGTGGMRGVLGPGTNRMNLYTVRKAVAGLARYLNENCVNVKDRGVVVAYDSRYQSQAFAIETARVLGVYGIKTYIFKSLRPTPVLSFAVRHLGTAAGIMITASHNPPEYNGFKVYNEDGGQIVPAEAEDVIQCINSVESELEVPVLDQQEVEDKGLLNWIDSEVDDAYLEKLLQVSKLNETELQKSKKIGIVFTPLHGTAHKLVTEGLKQLNFSNVTVVEEQAEPDPEFSTVESPNPEEHQAFAMAIEEGARVGADILLGTDPDADRLGVAVKDSHGNYTVLTGNQLGVLMLDYLLARTDHHVLKSARVLKTIVTTELGRRIAESYGAKTIDTLTGFKFIGEKIREFDATGETFVFGFEESYGYLIQNFARDKDAVQAAMVASEMAYEWKKEGKTLLEALDVLYEKHGYYFEDMSSLTLKGIEGSEQINQIMSEIRSNPPQEIGGLEVQRMEDYMVGARFLLQKDQHEPLDLPKENVVKFLLEEDSWVTLRPSGTEPKIKCYYGVSSNDHTTSKTRLKAMKKEMEALMDGIVNA
ncbi:Phosphoglucomutase (alpha-D-glucose-1,6-bisphosphate-dependent) [Lentibacillus sp. JNUCC-1]|uniref:phospho-sugar mutase n=1 Tax=Lentibacillus sp. JNUCC-1 TaxID=2654513 RepID=UPI0012E8688C|nr:phospho-sugar mutase [Lentibacillus sp. JNUCC-1]MUV37460.1 Phosphoglucomutase (alpha-D-glucose-1,6-bisphosphate-dependent) [Lentibacillus sp. JNUCC-1]